MTRFLIVARSATSRAGKCVGEYTGELTPAQLRAVRSAVDSGGKWWLVDADTPRRARQQLLAFYSKLYPHKLSKRERRGVVGVGTMCNVGVR